MFLTLLTFSLPLVLFWCVPFRKGLSTTLLVTTKKCSDAKYGISCNKYWTSDCNWSTVHWMSKASDPQLKRDQTSHETSQNLAFYSSTHNFSTRILCSNWNALRTFQYQPCWRVSTYLHKFTIVTTHLYWLGQHPLQDPVTRSIAAFAWPARPAVVEKSTCHQPSPLSQACQLWTVRPLQRSSSRKHWP